jgi:hypothetical protein
MQLPLCFESYQKAPGVPPSPLGYFGRKILIFRSIQQVAVCKILIIDELLAKYYK